MCRLLSNVTSCLRGSLAYSLFRPFVHCMLRCHCIPISLWSFAIALATTSQKILNLFLIPAAADSIVSRILGLEIDKNRMVNFLITR